jgi:hypothetical protein
MGKPKMKSGATVFSPTPLEARRRALKLLETGVDAYGDELNSEAGS